MGWRQAQRAAQNVRADVRLRVRKYTTRSGTTGSYKGPPTVDAVVWANREDTRSELNIGADDSLLLFPKSFVIRYDQRFEALTGSAITISDPGVPNDGTKLVGQNVVNVEPIGRRRFIRLEVEA